MGNKVQVSDITNITNASGVAVSNSNFDELADEFDKVLYRDGSQTVEGDLDMDSNRILNLPDAVSLSEPMTLRQLETLVAEAEDLDLAIEVSLRQAGDESIVSGLSATSGSNTVGFVQTGTGAAARTAQGKLRETVTPGDFTGGFVPALSAVRNNDTTAFSGAVEMTNGVTQITSTQSLPVSFARVRGNKGSTYWQMNAAESVFTASGSDFVLSSFEGFRTYGGVHAFNVSTSGEIASLSFRNMDISQFTGNAFNFAGGLTSSTFENVGMDGGTGADYGIYSAGGINNDNRVKNVTFLSLTKSAIKSIGLTQGLNIDARVEHGGLDGQFVYDFEGAVGVRIGGWKEGHHEYLLRLATSSLDPSITGDGGVLLDGIVDIGATDGMGFKASKFDVGARLIVLGSNVWSKRTTAPLNCLVYGLNDKLSLDSSNVWEHKSGRGGKVHLKRRDRSVEGSTFDLLTFTRPASTPNDFTNLQILKGTLHINFLGPDNVGVTRTISRSYPIQVFSEGNGTVTINSGITASSQLTVENAGPVTFTPQAKAGATSTSATLELVSTSIHASLNSLIDVSFEFQNNTNLASNALEVAPA